MASDVETVRDRLRVHVLERSGLCETSPAVEERVGSAGPLVSQLSVLAAVICDEQFDTALNRSRHTITSDECAIISNCSGKEKLKRKLLERQAAREMRLEGTSGMATADAPTGRPSSSMDTVAQRTECQGLVDSSREASVSEGKDSTDISNSAPSRFSDIPNNLKTHLPTGFEYRLISYAPTSPTQYESCVRINISTPELAARWLTAYQALNRVTLREAFSGGCEGRYIVYKRYMRCQHRTRPRSATADTRRGSKNTNCEASLTITVRRTNLSLKTLRNKRYMKNKKAARGGDGWGSGVRGGDAWGGAGDAGFPCVVKIKHAHNHALDAAESLRHRDVSEGVRARIRDLFASGHTPSSALTAHKLDLQRAHGDRYKLLAADRALCPDVSFCYRLYYAWLRSVRSTAPTTDADKTQAYDVTSPSSSCSNLRMSSCTEHPAATNTHVRPTECTAVQPVTEALTAHTAVEGCQLLMDVTTRVMQSAESLCRRIEDDPRSLLTPALNFLKAFESLSSNSLLAPALSGFGKCATLRASEYKTKPKCKVKNVSKDVVDDMQVVAVRRKAVASGRCLQAERRARDGSHPARRNKPIPTDSVIDGPRGGMVGLRVPPFTSDVVFYDMYNHNF